MTSKATDRNLAGWFPERWSPLQSQDQTLAKWRLLAQRPVWITGLLILNIQALGVSARIWVDFFFF